MSTSSNAAGGGGPTSSAQARNPVTGTDRHLFDDNDLPKLQYQDREATIGQLLRKFKFDHVDAAADRSNIEEFWPAKVLERLLSRDRIIRDLKRKRDLLTGIQGQSKSLADIVLGQHSTSQGEKYVKILALLCFLGREKEIKSWIKLKMSDDSFPFKLRSDRMICDRRNRLLECVQNWSEVERESLIRKQWSISVPYFKLDRHGKAMHEAFHGSTMLPWRKLTADDHLSWESSNRAEGGYAIVQGVMMAKSSYDFDRVLKKLMLKPNGFALKKIKVTPPADVLQDAELLKIKPKLKEQYEFEVDILKQFGNHAQHHLIFLLTSFTMNYDLCFLFPYADCDLQAYWVDPQRAPVRDSDYMKWISRQLRGLTSAVRLLHAGKEATDGTFTAKMFTDGKKRYCRHGDIRPENILWFRSKEDKYGILVLSDMGVSVFNRTVSRSKQPRRYVAQIPGYHPPESVTAGGEVDRTFDIWSLGCVYLEMMAWALGGRRYLYEFKEARIEEPSTVVQSDIFYKIVTVVDQRGNHTDEAMVKDQVTKWIGKMHDHENCTPFINDVLNTIEAHMLVIAGEGDGQKRSDAEVLGPIFEKLSNLGNQCYMSGEGKKKRVPWAKVKVSVDPALRNSGRK